MMMIMGMMMTRIFRRKIVCWSFTWFIHLAYDDPVIWWFSCTKSWIDSPIAKRSSRPSNLIGIKITFWEKMVCFTKLTPRTPPSVIHGWKATDLLYEMVRRKNYWRNPISRQNFANALAENHNLKLEVCHKSMLRSPKLEVPSIFCHFSWPNSVFKGGRKYSLLNIFFEYSGERSWCWGQLRLKCSPYFVLSILYFIHSVSVIFTPILYSRVCKMYSLIIQQ